MNLTSQLDANKQIYFLRGEESAQITSPMFPSKQRVMCKCVSTNYSEKKNERKAI